MPEHRIIRQIDWFVAENGLLVAMIIPPAFGLQSLMPDY
jgi:hypothetical protein